MESCKLSECFINITIKYCGIKIPIDLGLQHQILFSCPWVVGCQYLSRNWCNETVSKMCQYVTRKRFLYIFITNYTGVRHEAFWFQLLIVWKLWVLEICSLQYHEPHISPTHIAFFFFFFTFYFCIELLTCPVFSQINK